MTASMTAPLAPDRLGLPPPPLELELIDAGRVAGRIRGDAVSFRGFADETEAAHAAWVAHRTLARRLARMLGARPIPVDSEPLAIERRDGAEVIVAGGAGGRPIATLLRPERDVADGADGAGSFGFEIRVPGIAADAPANELQVRAAAHQMYRALRKSGLRWAMWRPAPGRPTAERVTDAAPARPRGARAGAAIADDGASLVSKVVLAAVALAATIVLIVAAPSTVTIPLAVALGAGVAATAVVAASSRRPGGARSPRGGRPSPLRAASDGRSAGAGDRRRIAPPAAAPLWQAVVAGSIALLMMALVLPGAAKVAAAMLGLAGLMAFRLSVMYGSGRRAAPV